MSDHSPSNQPDEGLGVAHPPIEHSSPHLSPMMAATRVAGRRRVEKSGGHKSTELNQLGEPEVETQQELDEEVDQVAIVAEQMAKRDAKHRSNVPLSKQSFKYSHQIGGSNPKLLGTLKQPRQFN